MNIIRKLIFLIGFLLLIGLPLSVISQAFEKHYKETHETKFIDSNHLITTVKIAALDGFCFMSWQDSTYFPFVIETHNNKVLLIDSSKISFDNSYRNSIDRMCERNIEISIYMHLKALQNEVHPDELIIDFVLWNSKEEYAIVSSFEIEFLLYSRDKDSIIKSLYLQNLMLKKNIETNEREISYLKRLINRYLLQIKLDYNSACCCGKGYYYDSLGTIFYCDNIEFALKCSKEKQKPILINFTTHGQSVRTVEEYLFSDKEISAYVRNNFIVLILFVNDRTKLPEYERFDSTFFDLEFKIKTIGDLNSFYQISHFNSNSQPYLVIMDETEKQLLKPIGYAKREDIYAFLINGKSEYEKQKSLDEK